MTPTTEHPTPQPILPQNVDFAAIVAEEKAQSNPYKTIDLEQPHKLVHIKVEEFTSKKGAKCKRHVFRFVENMDKKATLFYGLSKFANKKIKLLDDYFTCAVADGEPYEHVDAFIIKSPCDTYYNVREIVQWHKGASLTKYLADLKIQYPHYRFCRDTSHVSLDWAKKENQRISDWVSQFIASRKSQSNPNH